ncbi:amidohydrolase [Kordiimonas sediminis]|uniref:Amidohydrolase n=2 Tax=Kordiimonas sediminis TaxID=1735581 RepID=A0A919AQI0_9PROT|nr:amidohydrolase [Kordiimonas sediminis]
MIDVATGKLIRPATLVIKDGLISAVNPGNTDPALPVTDLEDQILLPGLMDMHSHVTLDYYTGDHWTTAPVMETPADWALHGVQFGQEMLHAGFTTVRDAGTFPGFADVALMRAIDAGRIVGPSIYPAGHYISITGGHCDVTGFAPGIMELKPEQGIANGKAEILRAVRYQAKHGVKVIKVCATAGVFSKGDSPGAQQYSDEELKVIVEEATRHGLKVMAHAHGSDGIMAAVKAGVASIEHGSTLTPEIVREMKKRGTYLVPTVYLDDIPLPPNTPQWTVDKNNYLTPLHEASFRLAVKEGVNIALGTDSGVMRHSEVGREFYAMVKRGMTEVDALKSATINAADLLGVSDRGQLKPGLRADIIAVADNPLEEIRTLERVTFVMKGGKIIKADP